MLVEVVAVSLGEMLLVILVLDAEDQLLAQPAPWNWLVKAG